MNLVISGGRVVTPGGVVDADISIGDGRIVGIDAPGTRFSHGELVQVDGATIIPGGIDTHTHLRDPGFTHKEDITSGTRAAVAGGYTTVVGMPNVDPPTNTLERYRDIIGLYREKSLVDFNHNPSPTRPSEVAALADEGALGFKIYMIEDTGRDYPHMPGVGVHHHGQLLEIAESVGATGRVLMVHPHDQTLMETIEGRFWEKGERDHRAYAKAFASLEGMVWDTATSFLIRLQEATGVHMHVLHVKTPRMTALIRDAKARGLHVTAELNPVAVFLCNEWENIERWGPYALSTWTGEGVTESLWEALNDQTIDVVGTDHAPHTREEKEIGWTDMWQAHGGVPSIEYVLSMFLTEVVTGRISLERVVELTATGPAKTFGLYPRKGVVQVGADADLVVVDLEAETTIREEDTLSKCGWTPFDGRKVRGMPVHTLVRGGFVLRDGKVVGEPGTGHHAKPQVN
ncbi:MAG: amidohydrolase family protein [Acidimicrobiia bacterium]|nr:amidohydrolase family protein [Acidimicrobiia bacterium]